MMQMYGTNIVETRIILGCYCRMLFFRFVVYSYCDYFHCCFVEFLRLHSCRQLTHRYRITMAKQPVSVVILLLVILVISLPGEIRGQGGAVRGAQAGAAAGRCPGVCSSNAGCSGCLRKLGSEVVCWTGNRFSSVNGEMCSFTDHSPVLCKNLACA